MKEEVERLLQRHNRLYKRRIELSNALDIIAEEVAIELNVTKNAVIQAITAQFKMVGDVIRLAERINEEQIPFENFKSIRLIYFGTFLPSKRKHEKVIEILKNKQNV